MSFKESKGEINMNKSWRYWRHMLDDIFIWSLLKYEQHLIIVSDTILGNFSNYVKTITVKHIT